jgi:hypothetical protein
VRWTLRRLDRHTPAWMAWLTPWGTSLALHTAAIAVFGLLVYVNSDGPKPPPGLETRFADQLTEDLTSANPADRSGDPFVTLETVEPPSIAPETKGAENYAIAESILPIGPGNGLMGPSADLSTMREKDGIGGMLAVPEPSVPFTGRQGAEKAKLVRREGGSVESEKAVERGLDWLARHQDKSGRWGMDPRPHCKGSKCPPSAHVDSDVAATGLALLPMLGAGHSHLAAGRYQANIKQGLDWLIAIQKEDGELFTGGGGNSLMYSHAIGAMALCEALGVTGDRRLRGPAEKAVAFIVKSQNPDDGGWRYNPRDAGDTSVFGWQMLALRSAQLSGIKVPPQTLAGATKYLDKAATDPSMTSYAYTPGSGASPVMSAEALLMRQYLGWPRESKELSNGVKHMAQHLLKVEERNIYYWYYATQLLHNMQNLAWKEWNPKIRNYLVSTQVGGTGCDRGSWSPAKPVGDRWGSEAGRHYLTAMSVLTLEVYYRYLPLYKARDKEISGTEGS